MWHYKARGYHPGIGRFLQVDPVGYQDQMNLYTYVGNDPVNITDPTGLARCSGNSKCEAVLAATDEARAQIERVRGDLDALAATIESGETLTADQEALRDAFADKFGSADPSTISKVSTRLGDTYDRIGARGEGARIVFSETLDEPASAPLGGNHITIGNSFFGDLGGVSTGLVIIHDAGHLSGRPDLPLPTGALGGREYRDRMIAYGETATSWLGANRPDLAARNNENYVCIVYRPCGGP